jgi:undecaprenyl-diphosphatase
MINTTLFSKINELAGHSALLDKLGVFFAVYSGYILVAVLIFIFFYKPTKLNRFMGIVALLSAAISRGVITTIIRFFDHSLRPFAVMKVTQLIDESGYSFPSGHAAFYFALSMAVYLYNKKLGIAFFAVSLVMGIARIYVGVHWPSDILGGILVGIVTALVVNFAVRKFIIKTL